MTGQRFRQVIGSLFCYADATHRDARFRWPIFYRRAGAAHGSEGSPFNLYETPPPSKHRPRLGRNMESEGRVTVERGMVVIELVTGTTESS